MWNELFDSLILMHVKLFHLLYTVIWPIYFIGIHATLIFDSVSYIMSYNTYKIYELFYASFISYYIDYNLSYDVLRFRHLLNNVEQYWHKYAFIGSNIACVQSKLITSHENLATDRIRLLDCILFIFFDFISGSIWWCARTYCYLLHPAPYEKNMNLVFWNWYSINSSTKTNPF